MHGRQAFRRSVSDEATGVPAGLVPLAAIAALVAPSVLWATPVGVLPGDHLLAVSLLGESLRDRVAPQPAAQWPPWFPGHRLRPMPLTLLACLHI